MGLPIPCSYIAESKLNNFVILQGKGHRRREAETSRWKRDPTLQRTWRKPHTCLYCALTTGNLISFLLYTLYIHCSDHLQIKLSLKCYFICSLSNYYASKQTSHNMRLLSSQVILMISGLVSRYGVGNFSCATQKFPDICPSMNEYSFLEFELWYIPLRSFLLLFTVTVICIPFTREFDVKLSDTTWVKT